MADVEIRNEGSIMLFVPNTDEAHDWLQEHTDGQWFGNALVVEPRYAGPLAEGLVDAGLSVE